MVPAGMEAAEEAHRDEWRRVVFNAWTAGRFKRGKGFGEMLRRFGLESPGAAPAKGQPASVSKEEALALAERIREADQRGT